MLDPAGLRAKSLQGTAADVGGAGLRVAEQAADQVFRHPDTRRGYPDMRRGRGGAVLHPSGVPSFDHSQQLSLARHGFEAVAFPPASLPDILS
ncbi:hypothetical protein J2848_005582 [Azospirillum lipoferum]|uniref:Uncharacterized protein n=1 Tax=Azospirillum lipoferum TaxID=193 RepID=A0A5A9GH43_AZOLI|nr:MULTISPECIES: hypothetical protein [Azospirillum]KAA0593052.1 hypothetical protein FZ942_26405 [Azospirillum lipoferum]MCP1613881.1 hypothetical protein [Azospirillum lipoferum]MDW5537724.1 hypothetical protein [Azospirillum sp. NL1]